MVTNVRTNNKHYLYKSNLALLQCISAIVRHFIRAKAIKDEKNGKEKRVRMGWLLSWYVQWGT